MSVKVYLQDGPCQGTTKILTDAEFKSGQTKCGGATYVDTGGYIGRPPVHLFEYQDTGGGGGGGGYKVPARVHKAWGDLQRSFNHHMPSALKHSRQTVDAGLRTLGHARKVLK